MIDQFSKQDLNSCLTRSKDYGFLSPQDINYQIEHSADFLDSIGITNGTAVDIGAGGGLPSLVWLWKCPEMNILAIDSMEKRTNFLKDIADEYKDLNERFTVLNARVETLGNNHKYREQFDTVVSRGFGSPAVTAECSSGLLKVNGTLYVSGRPENEELRWDKKQLELLGLEFEEVRTGKYSHVAVLTKRKELDHTYPRTTKQISKKPLW
ncbi:MAG: RsmG family class I SAM-dependent methyltransferase [Acidimicrobiia bacterium]